MVFTKAASQSAKRKKTDDMPDSPPKRVTRARAKATTDDTDTKSKVTKIITASAKVSVEKKRLAEPAKASKRKTRADDVAADPLAKAVPNEEVKEPLKPRVRQKKAKEDVKDALPALDVPAPTRARQSKVVVSEETSLEAPKLRGRPKKVTTISIKSSSEAEKAKLSEPAKENVRDGANLPIKANTREPAKKTATIRKKVQFQDEPEEGKENVPFKNKASEKPIAKATGLKAKPVRKPATVRGATRGKKVQEQKNVDDEVKVVEVRPLSPKKVKQVAKSSSIGSEDELGVEKTPVRALSRSPVKSPVRSIQHDISRLDFSTVNVHSSSIVNEAQSELASPARRPPPSPFKEAFKDSPKRINLGDTVALPILNNSRSPAKTALLQSPARRPPVSPIKLMAVSSPRKAGAAMSLLDPASTSKQAKPLRIPFFSPSKTISSPLRATTFPERPFKVHKIDGAEQVAASDSKYLESPVTSNTLEDDPVPTKTIDSSLSDLENQFEKADVAESRTFVPSEKNESTMIYTDDMVLQNQFEQSSMENDGDQSTTPPDLPDPFVAPAFSFAAPRLRFIHEESDSEDELSSARKPCILTQAGKQGILSEKLDTSMSGGDIEWTPIPSGNMKAYAMTPLATQLSNWLASSPEKQTAGQTQKRGIFSPMGPTLLDKPVPAMDCSLAETPPKTSFFEDEMATRENENQDSSPRPGSQEIRDMIEASQDSQASEEYGDENAMPVDPQLMEIQHEANETTITCTPAKVFLQPREIHTVSKVPLRPSDEDSPLRVTRKRSRSLAGPLRSVNSIGASSLGRLRNIPSDFQGNDKMNEIQASSLANQSYLTPIEIDSGLPQTPRTSSWSGFSTPATTIKKGVASNILEGAVVYVDVHTTEGADASGIFLELLAQMGARCVKQWAWNPRTGNASGDDETAILSDSALSGNKVGITHVIYKDGGKRTLEKVREAKGVVLCVGVGWVLE